MHQNNVFFLNLILTSTYQNYSKIPKNKLKKKKKEEKLNFGSAHLVGIQ
jgi:hypothetical protein